MLGGSLWGAFGDVGASLVGLGGFSAAGVEEVAKISEFCSQKERIRALWWLPWALDGALLRHRGGKRGANGDQNSIVAVS